MTVGDAHWHMIDEIDLAGMVSDHAGLGQLCDRLEALADSLPEPPAEETVDFLRSELENRVPIHDARERAMLDRLFGRGSLRALDAAVLAQIGARRTSCVVQAQDLVAALRGDGAVPAPETLGYMLRCFFQACRQAMAFEELGILHLAADRLTPAGRSLLAHSLVRRCGG